MDAATEVLRLEWSGFTFRIKGQAERREHSFKFEVNALYQNRNWSTFEVELVFAEVYAEELVAAIDLTAFGLLRPSPIPCMTVEEQIAQKLHAVSDPSEDRPRDLIDIHLFITRLTPDIGDILAACVRTFELRATHQWPPNIKLARARRRKRSDEADHRQSHARERRDEEPDLKKLVGPSQRKAAVRALQSEGLSERTACRLAKCPRSVAQYQSRRSEG